MKTKWRRFAPLALVLAGLALLVSIGAYILQQQFSIVVRIGLIVAVISLAFNIFMDPGKARAALTGRQARYGSNALILSLAFLGILIIGNYLVFSNDKRWDLTEDQENSLASETIDILGRLEQPVVAKAFYTQRNTALATGEDLLGLFSQESGGLFSYEIIDPEADPVAAQQAGVTRDGDIVLSMGERQEKASFVSEQNLASALVKLLGQEEQTVYFVTGHGEFDPAGTGERSYSSVKLTLENKNYTVNTLNLLTVSEVPQDASAVVVAGPVKPLTEGEINLLRIYFNQGGSLFILIDPSVFTETGSSADPMIPFLEQDFGIVANDDVLIDLVGQSQLGQPLLAVGARYGSHAITQGLENFATVFPQARSLQIVDDFAAMTPQEIVFTQDQSWGETDLEGFLAGDQVEQNTGVDHMGPVALAVAAEKVDSDARVVVVGDSDFAADGNSSAFGNMDLFINSLDWAVGQEELIQLTPKTTTTRTLKLPSITYMTGLVILVAIFLLPGIVLAAGIIVAISRRRRM